MRVDAAETMLNLRRCRFVVLAVLLLSLIGPWGAAQHEGGYRRRYFPEVAVELLRSAQRLDAVLLAVTVAVPLACCAVILMPTSVLAVIIYRVMALGGVAIFALVVLGVRPSRRHEILDVWGISLYMVAIVLALAVEAVCRRREGPRDCGDTFR